MFTTQLLGTQLLNTASTAAATHSQVAAHWGGPWSGGFHWFFLIVPLLWIALIVFLVTFFARRRRAAWHNGGYGYGYGHPGFGAARVAEQTLAERFAQGDIDEVEYRARLEVLRANRPNGGAS